MRRPNLNSLRAFDAAARRLTFAAAAEDLHVTQGAVAQQVRRLEQDLGMALFRRHARGLHLTEAGKRFHSDIAKAFAIIDAATAKIAPEQKAVRISVPPSFAAKWLVPRLAGFADRHADVDVQVIALEGLMDLSEDGADVLVRQGPSPKVQNAQWERLADLDLVAVCAPSMAQDLGTTPNLDALLSRPLIQDGHRHWDPYLQANEGPTPRVLQLNQTALALDAAAGGQGIALAPRLLAAADVAAGRLKVVWRPDGSDQQGFHLIFAEDLAPGGSIARLIDWLRAEIGVSAITKKN